MNKECVSCKNVSPHDSWDLVKYRWNPNWFTNETAPAMIDIEIKETIREQLSPTDIVIIVTNYVNEHEPDAAQYRWHNTTGDDYDWEYCEGGFEDFSGRSVYGMFPTEQREILKI